MRILVVEDEHKLAGVLKRGLEEHGYAVDVAYDGEDGLALAVTTAYDLIVLDVMLPKVDGLSLCHQLRGQNRHMPVLMLTARDAVDDRVAGLDSGADDYLTKPFAFREFLARIRALLRRDGLSARDPILRVADLQIDTVSHEVRRAGKLVELTSKEYAILEYFARNPNRVLTRTQIAEHELRTPLAMLASQIDVARMSQLVGELLTLARADADQQLLTREELDLGDLVRSVVPTMQLLAQQRGVQLSEHLAPGVRVSGDQMRLTQLLINLTDNAIRYTPPGGRASVSVARDGAFTSLRVEDTGVGIDPEHLPHVFERFYRVDPSRARADGGAGLGLAICQWIAQAHGGDISVESTRGRGSVFTVRLPVMRTAADARPPEPADIVATR